MGKKKLTWSKARFSCIIMTTCLTSLRLPATAEATHMDTTSEVDNILAEDRISTCGYRRVLYQIAMCCHHRYILPYPTPHGLGLSPGPIQGSEEGAASVQYGSSMGIMGATLCLYSHDVDPAALISGANKRQYLVSCIVPAFNRASKEQTLDRWN